MGWRMQARIQYRSNSPLIKWHGLPAHVSFFREARARSPCHRYLLRGGGRWCFGARRGLEFVAAFLQLILERPE